MYNKYVLSKSIFNFALYAGMSIPSIFAQYDPPAGQPNSLAIEKSDSRIRAWATYCTAQLGWQDISRPQLGYVNSGTTNDALGQAGEGGVLSLGDGGVATLEFAHTIRNGQGADFAVFENGFSDTFLELALVEVSSDGVRFVRFPAVSNIDTTVQIGAFGSVDATKLYNLAGKYRANYGVGFDLDELKDSANLDVNAISHVRIIDAVGSMNEAYAVRDSRGTKINDPWATPFASSGFDLDAVGVLHDNNPTAVTETADTRARLHLQTANPMRGGDAVGIQILFNAGTLIEFEWVDRLGIVQQSGKLSVHSGAVNIPTTTLAAGVYHLRLTQPTQWREVVTITIL